MAREKKIFVKVGDKKNYLTVISSYKKAKLRIRNGKPKMWNINLVDCACVCGNVITTREDKFYDGSTRSCGCMRQGLMREKALKKYLEKTRFVAPIDRLIVNSYVTDAIEYLTASGDGWVKDGMAESEFQKKKTEMFTNTQKFLKY